jgi:hypothetical protein
MRFVSTESIIQVKSVGMIDDENVKTINGRTKAYEQRHYNDHHREP